jgi:hypothetical protein
LRIEQDLGFARASKIPLPEPFVVPVFQIQRVIQHHHGLIPPSEFQLGHLRGRDGNARFRQRDISTNDGITHHRKLARLVKGMKNRLKCHGDLLQAQNGE